MKVRQSDIKTWQKCPLLFRFQNIEGLPRLQSGSLTFGSIIHDCVVVLETTGDLQKATDRFRELWAAPILLGPEYPVDYYVRGTSWVKFMEAGPQILKAWHDLNLWSSNLVICREHSFEVPIGKNGHTLVGTVDKLEVVFDGTLNTWVVKVVDFKGLALDTRLPTPTGWTTMGEVREGDEVIGGDGLPCHVVAKSQIHDRACYRITFDDRSTIVADNEHLWQVQTNGGEKLMATEDLLENLVDPVTGQRHLKIPNVATSLPNVDLEIDPYVLGAWLGDGNSHAATICKPLPALFAEIERRGYRVGQDISGPERAESRTIHGLRHSLVSLGLLGAKRIPDAYLRASYQQRLDLLQGLMDTDGHWNSTRKRCVLTTVDSDFAEQVRELVVSLGWKASVFPCQRSGFGKTVTAYDVCFTPVDEDVFVARVPQDYRSAPAERSRRRMVMSVELIESVPTQCIAVDSPENTYLAGEQMVVTHNTNKKTPTYEYLAEDLQFSAYGYATTRPEFWAGLPNGAALYEKYKDFPRTGEWIQLVQGTTYTPKRIPAGPRTERHFNRVAYAVDQLAASVAMEIFPPNISGESCRYCEFRETCGLPLLDDDGREILPFP